MIFYSRRGFALQGVQEYQPFRFFPPFLRLVGQTDLSISMNTLLPFSEDTWLIINNPDVHDLVSQAFHKRLVGRILLDIIVSI